MRRLSHASRKWDELSQVRFFSPFSLIGQEFGELLEDEILGRGIRSLGSLLWIAASLGKVLGRGKGYNLGELKTRGDGVF
jgi:hypothetical protein